MNIQKIIFISFSILGLLLFLIPKIDIAIAGYFYDSYNGFIYKSHPIVVMCFNIVPILSMTFGAILLCCLVYKFYIISDKRKILYTPVFYLLITLALGPGLLVNTVLKEHFGRARPTQILEFGGNKAFSSPLVISQACASNCSFSSGHAAMGYYFSAISYIVPVPFRVIIFISGILFGSIVGLGRMMQGGHFFSDVIFSGIFVITINHVMSFLIIDDKPTARQKKKRSYRTKSCK